MTVLMHRRLHLAMCLYVSIHLYAHLDIHAQGVTLLRVRVEPCWSLNKASIKALLRLTLCCWYVLDILVPVRWIFWRLNRALIEPY
jgi:hypothetical protein